MISVIPLRAGSKSIPHKNVRSLAGRPLAAWVIEASLRAANVRRTIVTTDDPLVTPIYRDFLDRFGPDSIALHERSPGSATDTASTESVLLEVARDLMDDDDVLCLLQATSPLTTATDIDGAWAVFAAGGWDSLLSVVPQHRFVWEAGPGGAQPLNYDPRARPRRQEMTPILVENGAIYITKVRALIDSGSRLSGRVGLYEMPAHTYVELDEPEDLHRLEPLVRDVRRRTLRSEAAGIQLVLSDVDGVLTDAGMYWSSDGVESKRFSARDGKGFQLLHEAGIRTGLLTSEAVELVRRRAEKLRTSVALDCTDKLAEADRLRVEAGLSWRQIAYIGDDVHDIDLMAAVGLSAAPADALPRVRSVAHLVTESGGGRGCFRELADLILESRSTAD
jgi:YrbI family 3-deoxy-D-manno-octulosonate 8-phosphate phosphatase